jgi:hypothetical protein
VQYYSSTSQCCHLDLLVKKCPIVDVHIGGMGGKANVDACGQGRGRGGVKKSDFVWTS